MLSYVGARAVCKSEDGCFSNLNLVVSFIHAGRPLGFLFRIAISGFPTLIYVSTSCITTGCIGDLAINPYIFFCYDHFPYDYNLSFHVL
jgi:hypothetical protein